MLGHRLKFTDVMNNNHCVKTINFHFRLTEGKRSTMEAISVLVLMLAATADCTRYVSVEGNLTSIPNDDIPTDTDNLDLYKNKINNLTYLGKYSSNLIYLDLSINRIPDIPMGFFLNCSSLLTLNISANRIANLPNEIFFGLIRLETLDLEDNNFDQMPTYYNTFHGLVSLERIYLSESWFKTLPCLGPHSPNLTYFYAQESGSFTLTDSCMNGLDSLISLDFTKTNTTFAISQYVFPRSLRYVRLYDVPNYGFAFNKTTELLCIDSEKSSSSVMPWFPYILHSIYSLSFTDGKLDCLGYGDLQRIQFASYMYFYNNQLQYFPDNTCDAGNGGIPPYDKAVPISLPNLQHIDLSNDWLVEFPDVRGARQRARACARVRK